MDKVQKQLTGISALVDFWWQTVRQDLEQHGDDPEVDTVGLSIVAADVLARINCAARATRGKSHCDLVLQAVEEIVSGIHAPDSLNPELLAGWKAWAAEHAKAFQRASSAV